MGYNISGVKDSIRDEFSGLLVEDDPEALSSWIVRVLSDDGLRGDLSRNAIEWAGEFSWDKTAEEFMKVVEWSVNEE